MKKSAHALTVVLADVETLRDFACSVVFDTFSELSAVDAPVIALFACFAITDESKDMVERLVVILGLVMVVVEVSVCSTRSCSLDISSIGLGVLISELGSTPLASLLQTRDNLLA